jgi:hypothetical protein
MKQYVDKVCGELESTLKSHIDQKLEALGDMMNKRLDEVLSKLG